MNSLQESILKVIAYFDIFYYPVTAQEILHFMNKPYSSQKLDNALDELLRNEIIFKTKDYYSLHNDQLFAVKRMKANEAAAKQLKIAKKIAALLIRVPFIKGVAIS